MERIAIIDLGSNSIRFIIEEISDTGAHSLIYQEKKTIRLAESFSGDRPLLSEEAQKRALSCLTVYSHIASTQHVTRLIAVATAAVRNAINGASFVKRARIATGIPLTIISGQAEAALGFSGVIHSIDKSDFILFDLGGASIEISLVENKKRVHSVSLPIGAVTLTKKFHTDDDPSPEALKKLKNYIQNTLKPIDWLPEEPMDIVGIGGTIRNLAKIHQRSSGYPLPKLHNYTIPIETLTDEIQMITKKSLDERRIISGLSYERADIIIAGSMVIAELVKQCHASELTVSGCGLREGLFHRYYDKKYDPSSRYLTDMLLSSVENYAASLPYTDKAHASFVTRLALAMFDQWQSVHKLSKRLRLLLNAAACLHDMGHIINYYNHARHGAYMAANAPIYGWSHKEQVIASLLIAFHHGYSGKAKRAFPQCSILSEKEMGQVKILSLFLSMAEALDESHEQAVTRIKCGMRDNSLFLRVYVDQFSVDVLSHATAPLVPNFERILGKPLLLEWFPEK